MKIKLSDQILSLALVFVMIVIILPITVTSARAAYESPCSGDHSGWTELAYALDSDSDPLSIDITEGGRYYLGSDIILY